MKRSIWLVASAVILAGGVFAGCGEAEEEEQQEETDAAAEVLSAISGYSSWEVLSEEFQPAAGPHGAFIRTHANSTAGGAITGESFPFPEGSVLLKEVYDEEQELMALDVMAKRDGEWFWLGANAAGTEVREMDGMALQGAIPMCVGCHAGTSPSAPTDFVFLQEYDL